MQKKKLWKRSMAVLLSGAVVAGGIAPSLPVMASETKSIVSLKTEGLENPIGIDNSKPVFSWQMQSDSIGAAQKAYQIVVQDMAGGTMWDSGKVESSASTYIEYEGKALSAKTQYQWYVTVTDEKGQSFTSQRNTFETSLMDTTINAWSGAQWIGSEELNFDAASACYFDMDVTLQIPEGSTKASFVFGADDYRLKNESMNIWHSEKTSYFKYEVDVTDKENPKLNIYVAGMPVKGQEKENPEEEADFSIAIPKEALASDAVHSPMTLNIATPSNINQVACTINGVVVDKSRQLNPMGNNHNYNSFPNVNSIGFSVPAGEKAYYSNLAIKYPGSNATGHFFDETTGATYDIFKDLDGVTVGTAPVQDGKSAKDAGVEISADDVDGAVMEESDEMDLAVEETPEAAENHELSIEEQDAADETEELAVGEEAVSGQAKAAPSSLTGTVITVNGGKNGVLSFADPSYGSAPMVRSEFTAKSKVASARLYVSAQGIYEMFINGDKVGDGWFNPGNAEYQTTMPYQVYDVTDMIKEGDNAIGAQLGEGWWSGYQSYTVSCYNFYGAKQGLLAKMDITYEDGTTETVVSDTDSWKVFTEGPVEYNSFYQGERYNAQTAEVYSDWANATYDDKDWDKPVEIEPNYDTFDFATRYDEQATVVKELTAKECLGESVEGTGSYIYDMGENVIGVPQITIPEGYVEEGAEVTLRFAEVLYPDLEEYQKADLVGSMMVENYRAALSTDFYQAKKGMQVIEPHFTFHGYRYIEITGLKKALPAKNVKTEVLSSVKMTATYDSSNPLVNRLFKNVQNSQTSNFLSLPTDCPQRNERMGWTGDAQVFSLAASYNADVYNFYRNWLVTLRSCQNGDGSLPVFAPTFQPKRDKAAPGFAGVSWDAALTTIPYNMYKQTGNTAIIEDNIEAMDKYQTYLASNPVEGYENLTTKTGILADWLSVDSTSADLINNAVYVYLIGLTRDMAEVIGRTDLVKKYSAKYDLAKAEWNKKYIDSETGKPYPIGKTENDTEAAYATPLRYGVFSAENEEKAVQNYLAAVEKAGYTITSGFSGTPNLVPVLTKYGYVEEAYKLFEQTEYASWLYPVTQGATSIWERWNSYTLDGGFNGNNSMNSFNHFSLGAISEWMMAYQLGITTEEDSAGYQKFVLQPTAGGSFTYANGSYDSDYGTIYSGWTSENGKMTSYKVTVPANTSATMYLEVGENVAKRLAANEGVSFVKMTTRNHKDVAEFSVKSGTYEFKDLTDAQKILDDAKKAEEAAKAAQAEAEKAKAEAQAAEAAAKKAEAAAKEAQKKSEAERIAAEKAAAEAKAAAAEAKEVLAQAQKAAAEAKAAADKLAKASVTKTTIRSVKSSSKKKAKVTWKKNASVSGYVIQYATNKSFKKAKTKTIKKGSATTATIKNLKSGKKYYFRVRAYKVSDGKKIYGAYSSKKLVKVK